jgi:toxin ParE1/3/4
VKVIIRDLAFADLERIFHWIERDSPANARAVAARILDAIENKIAIFPLMGRLGRITGTREWVISGLPYLIVYEVDRGREAVTVLGIVHGARQR